MSISSSSNLNPVHDASTQSSMIFPTVHRRGTENTEAPKVKAFFHHEAHEEHEDGINRGEDNVS
jgi:hypothetical protein